MMRLTKLVEAIDDCELRTVDDPDIRRIDYDSRNVEPGSLFVAITGEITDGHKYISNAFDLGASAVVVENVTDDLKGKNYIHVSDSRKSMALLGKHLAGDPDRDLRLVGITGTNGKTTTASILGEVFKEAYGKSGVIGTLGGKIGDDNFNLERTTPEAPDLYHLILKMKLAGCGAAAMEVSSHALSLHRTFGMEFTAAAFTNLSQDHLDFHGDIESYFKAKAQLFTDYSVGNAVINLDDSFGRRLVKLSSAPVVTYSLSGDADVQAVLLVVDNDGVRMRASTPRGDLEFLSPLLGNFNAYNLICALAIAEAYEIDHEHFVKAVGRFKGIPGRMERFDLPDGRVFIDYSHTPEALELALTEIQKLNQGEVHVLFGCGGNRDREKRPMMGRAAEKYADLVYITTDNPRDEDPEAIADEILSGFTDPSFVTVQLDRRKAIVLALNNLPQSGALLIAGKGHENYQEIEGVRYHLDDSEEVAAYINGLKE